MVLFYTLNTLWFHCYYFVLVLLCINENIISENINPILYFKVQICIDYYRILLKFDLISV